MSTTTNYVVLPSFTEISINGGTPISGSIAIDQGTGIAIVQTGQTITISSTSPSFTAFVTREVPSGPINGSNPTFTLAHTPIVGSEMLYVDGVLQNEGISNDYTISGAVITFNLLTIPTTNEVMLCSYRY